MELFPPGLFGREYYRPKESGWEARVRERLRKLRRKIRGEKRG